MAIVEGEAPQTISLGPQKWTVAFELDIDVKSITPS